MKIVYVINSYDNGGAELGLATLAENGFFAGHDVTVQALVAGSGTVRSRLGVALSAERVQALSEATVLANHHLMPFVLRLAWMLRRDPPDLLILSLPQANLVGRLASLAVPRTVVVSFEHSIVYRRRSAYWLLKATSRQVDHVFYDHAETWAAVHELFAPTVPAHFVPLMLLEARAAPPPLPEGRWRLLTTGRLSEEKNLRALVQAVRLLLDRGRDIELTIAGDGPLRSELAALVARLGLEDHVRLPGFIADCATLRQQADIYVQPSLREGLCLAVLEAMAAGMVVVANDIGGIRLYGLDGGNMLKLTGTGPAEIAAVIDGAIAQPSALPRLQEGALETVRSGFSPAMVRQHWQRALAAAATPHLIHGVVPTRGAP